MEIPESVVGIVSGGIRNEEHLEVAHAMRDKCQVLIALGTCATHGGIPSLINQFDNEELFERYYRTRRADHTLRRQDADLRIAGLSLLGLSALVTLDSPDVGTARLNLRARQRVHQ